MYIDIYNEEKSTKYICDIHTYAIGLADYIK